MDIMNEQILHTDTIIEDCIICAVASLMEILFQNNRRVITVWKPLLSLFYAITEMGEVIKKFDRNDKSKDPDPGNPTE